MNLAVIAALLLLGLIVVVVAVACVIELDDKSHQRRDRQQRDAFVNEALSVAGIPLARIPAASEYPIDRVQQHLQQVLS